MTDSKFQKEMMNKDENRFQHKLPYFKVMLACRPISTISWRNE